MVVGGLDDRGFTLDTVELISLDPANHPVPERPRQLANYPGEIKLAGGAALKDGNRCSI